MFNRWRSNDPVSFDEFEDNDFLRRKYDLRSSLFLSYNDTETERKISTASFSCSVVYMVKKKKPSAPSTMKTRQTINRLEEIREDRAIHAGTSDQNGSLHPCGSRPLDS